MDSEAELATVLGHEIAHVTARHSVTQLSRQQMADVFTALQRLDTSERSALPSWLATHPTPAERVEEVKQRLASQPSKPGARIGRAEYLGQIDNLVYGEDPRQGFSRRAGCLRIRSCASGSRFRRDGRAKPRACGHQRQRGPDGGSATDRRGRDAAGSGGPAILSATRDSRRAHDARVDQRDRRRRVHVRG